MAILRPSSDLITGGWTSTDASLSAAIDETTYSDTDYISTSTAGQIARVSLGTYTAEAPALILKRDVWKQQPQVPVGIDYGKYSPAFVYSPTNSILMPVLGSLLTQTGTVTKAPTAKGISAKIAVSGYLSRTSYAPIRTSNGAFTGDFTAIVLANPAAGASSGRTLISQRLDSGGFNQFGITANANSLGSASGSIFFATYDSAYTSCELAGAVDGLWHVWAIRRKGTVLTGWKDGIQIASVDGAVRSIGSSSAGFGIGVAPPSYNILSAVDIPFASGFNYALTDAQMCELGANPWQIFKPKSRPIFITPPRGTHTLKYRACSPEADRGLIARVLELGQPPAIILKRDVWTSQPQVPIGIDWGNHVTAGLRRAIVSSSPFDAISLSSVTRSNLVASKNGIAAKPTGANVPLKYGLYLEGTYFRLSAGKSFTLVAVVPEVMLAGSNSGVWREGGSSTGTTFCIVQGGGSNRPWIRVNGTDVLKPGSGPQLISGGSYTIAYRVTSGVEASVFWGGAKQHTATHSTATAQSDFYQFGFQSATTEYLGSLSGVYLYDSAVSDSALIEITRNPWQIFQKKSRHIFIDAPKVIATQTTTSGTIATTPTDYTLTLSSGEAAAITNGAELALEVEST